MEDETESQTEEQAPDSGPPIVLGYQSPQRPARAIASPAYLFCGVTASILGILMLLSAIGIVHEVVTSGGPWFDEDWLRRAAIVALLIFGAAAATRCAWYYFGGWAETPDKGKRVRKIVPPWK